MKQTIGSTYLHMFKQQQKSCFKYCDVLLQNNSSRSPVMKVVICWFLFFFIALLSLKSAYHLKA